MDMRTAGGESVRLEATTSGLFGKLRVDYYGSRAMAFLAAAQLRELAGAAMALAEELESKEA